MESELIGSDRNSLPILIANRKRDNSSIPQDDVTCINFNASPTQPTGIKLCLMRNFKISQS
ncbi:hypothetical protein [Leptolyngbya sp. FACHB-1624]|uniref:hypothetical protein n=1 Tax=Leptolyngbya sp. FACHB-1624 TaxID=2692802 RepID=UPI0039E85AD6